MSSSMPGGGSRRVRESQPASDTQAPAPTADRITVALIPQTAVSLRRIQERTGLSKTDIVNRAITLYEFIDAEMRAGADLLIRDPKTGQTQIVKLL